MLHRLLAHWRTTRRRRAYRNQTRRLSRLGEGWPR